MDGKMLLYGWRVMECWQWCEMKKLLKKLFERRRDDRAEGPDGSTEDSATTAAAVAALEAASTGWIQVELTASYSNFRLTDSDLLPYVQIRKNLKKTIVFVISVIIRVIMMMINKLVIYKKLRTGLFIWYLLAHLFFSRATLGVYDISVRSMDIDDWQPTDLRANSHILQKFQMAVTLQRDNRSPSCLVLGWGFWDGGLNGAISGWTNSRWRPAAILENFKWPYLSDASWDSVYVCTQTILCHWSLMYNDGDLKLIS